MAKRKVGVYFCVHSTDTKVSILTYDVEMFIVLGFPAWAWRWDLDVACPVSGEPETPYQISKGASGWLDAFTYRVNQPLFGTKTRSQVCCDKSCRNEGACSNTSDGGSPQAFMNSITDTASKYRIRSHRFQIVRIMVPKNIFLCGICT